MILTLLFSLIVNSKALYPVGWTQGIEHQHILEETLWKADKSLNSYHQVSLEKEFRKHSQETRRVSHLIKMLELSVLGVSGGRTTYLCSSLAFSRSEWTCPPPTYSVARHAFSTMLSFSLHTFFNFYSSLLSLPQCSLLFILHFLEYLWWSSSILVIP